MSGEEIEQLTRFLAAVCQGLRPFWRNGLQVYSEQLDYGDDPLLAVFACATSMDGRRLAHRRFVVRIADVLDDTQFTQIVNDVTTILDGRLKWALRR